MAIKERPTLKEFLKLPELEPALEFIDGVVTQKMSPTIGHGGVQVDLAQHFNGFGRPRKLARAFSEVRTTYAGASFVPDLVVYVWERIPADADGNLPREVFDPPDIAVEIRSPSQSIRSQVVRCLWYVEHGVRIAIFVDPLRRTVEVFRPDSRTGPLHNADRIDLDDVLPGFQLTVAELFESLKAR